MSTDDLKKAYKKLERKVSRTANEVANEADKDLQKVGKQAKAMANDLQETFKNEYADMERKAIQGMTDVLDKTKAELKAIQKDRKSSSSDLSKKVNDLKKKASAELEKAKKLSDESFDTSIQTKLQKVCAGSEDYYKCTLNEAYKKATELFDSQKKEFADKSGKAYSNIIKEMDKGYSAVLKEAEKALGSDQPGSSKGRKSK